MYIYIYRCIYCIEGQMVVLHPVWCIWFSFIVMLLKDSAADSRCHVLACKPLGYNL